MKARAVREPPLHGCRTKAFPFSRGHFRPGHVRRARQKKSPFGKGGPRGLSKADRARRAPTGCFCQYNIPSILPELAHCLHKCNNILPGHFRLDHVRRENKKRSPGRFTNRPYTRTGPHKKKSPLEKGETGGCQKRAGHAGGRAIQVRRADILARTSLVI